MENEEKEMKSLTLDEPKEVTVELNDTVTEAPKEVTNSYDPEAPIGNLRDLNKYNLTDKGKRQREYLAKQDLVQVIIPPSSEKGLKDYPFNMNGYKFAVPIGVFVMAPKDVANYIVNIFMPGQYVLDNHALNIRNADESTLSALR